MFALLGRGLRGFWRLLDGTRRLLMNLLFLLLARRRWSGPSSRAARRRCRTRPCSCSTCAARWSNNAAAAGATPRSAARAGRRPQQVQLRDVLRVLDAAAKDPKITQALLLLDDFRGAGLATLRELAAAVQRFKASGKPVVAWGSSFDQRQYHVAAAASEVLLHPMGMVQIEGYGRLRNYYRDALDKLGVTREPDPRRHLQELRRDLHRERPVGGVDRGRAPALRRAVGHLHRRRRGGAQAAGRQRWRAASTNCRSAWPRPAATWRRLALDAKLVDGLKTRDELRADADRTRRARRRGRRASARSVSTDYLSRAEATRHGGDALAVVVAEGEISDGEAPPGRIGGLSTAALIRKAREDDEIKALVLRVDSPGGSAFGAELVRRELELTRAAGKPVVVSMGDVAASGGYWVATAADEVIADAATVTGSIGVFTLLPTAEKALDKLGVHTGGVTTTWLGGAFDPRRALDPRFAALVQSSVDHTYADFIAKVAAGAPAHAAADRRGGAGPRVDRRAGARSAAWSTAWAVMAMRCKAAAQRGKLAGADSGDFRITYLEREPGRLQRLVELFGGTVLEALGRHIDGAWPAAGLPLAAAREMQHELLWLAELTQQRRPFVLAVHCLCGDP